jgi:putative alpha-1,2-mannosidase
MGGKQKFEQALDSIFEKKEYWHGNEPGQQIPFLYSYIRKPHQLQQRVDEILINEYDDGPGGLCGNDDAGQISAWYVFAAMGFYPVNPVAPAYTLARPLFERITIQTGPATTATFIVHVEKGKTPSFITSVKKNGKKYSPFTLLHKDLMQGGVFEFTVTDSSQ